MRHLVAALAAVVLVLVVPAISLAGPTTVGTAPDGVQAIALSGGSIVSARAVRSTTIVERWTNGRGRRIATIPGADGTGLELAASKGAVALVTRVRGRPTVLAGPPAGPLVVVSQCQVPDGSLFGRDELEATADGETVVWTEPGCGRTTAGTVAIAEEAGRGAVRRVATEPGAMATDVQLLDGVLGFTSYPIDQRFDGLLQDVRVRVSDLAPLPATTHPADGFRTLAGLAPGGAAMTAVARPNVVGDDECTLRFDRFAPDGSPSAPPLRGTCDDETAVLAVTADRVLTRSGQMTTTVRSRGADGTRTLVTGVQGSLVAAEADGRFAWAERRCDDRISLRRDRDRPGTPVVRVRQRCPIELTSARFEGDGLRVRLRCRAGCSGAVDAGYFSVEFRLRPGRSRTYDVPVIPTAERVTLSVRERTGEEVLRRTLSRQAVARARAAQEGEAGTTTDEWLTLTASVGAGTVVARTTEQNLLVVERREGGRTTELARLPGAAAFGLAASDDAVVVSGLTVGADRRQDPTGSFVLAGPASGRLVEVERCPGGTTYPAPVDADGVRVTWRRGGCSLFAASSIAVADVGALPAARVELPVDPGAAPTRLHLAGERVLVESSPTDLRVRGRLRVRVLRLSDGVVEQDLPHPEDGTRVPRGLLRDGTAITQVRPGPSLPFSALLDDLGFGAVPGCREVETWSPAGQRTVLPVRGCPQLGSAASLGDRIAVLVADGRDRGGSEVRTYAADGSASRVLLRQADPTPIGFLAGDGRVVVTPPACDGRPTPRVLPDADGPIVVSRCPSLVRSVRYSSRRGFGEVVVRTTKPVDDVELEVVGDAFSQSGGSGDGPTDRFSFGLDDDLERRLQAGGRVTVLVTAGGSTRRFVLRKAS